MYFLGRRNNNIQTKILDKSNVPVSSLSSKLWIYVYNFPLPETIEYLK